MPLDEPLLQLLAPLMFVAGSIYLLGPTLPLSRSWARIAIFICVWAIVVWYLDWRIFTTVLPADGRWYEIGWIWFCFGIEALALLDAFILYVAFLKRSDRRAEADANETRLRALPPDRLPYIDVFIPTYDEPLAVLEKTITGALYLDYPNVNVWVLDDGRRSWLKEFCESKGAGYITRPDNKHAKAGNINHALTKTNGQFVAIFDADFVVQRNFLMRTMGFFKDPEVGIVQVPHMFYNADPMQTNLGLQTALPDDQRFFFEAIMPSRDAWNAAFCCGSNSVTRRDALRSIGDALPTESITEDMLLTLMLLRQGFITRYVCEPLAFGLAPEGLKAFFIQRKRWARGALQILYLPAGPFGKGLTLMQRLLFLPTHWLTQSLTFSLAIAIPLVYVWTGLLPMANVSVEGILTYLLPMVFALVGGVCIFAPKQYFPLAVQVLGTFQSFKLLPAILLTLVRPSGHSFKVTPKGKAARSQHYDREVFWTAAVLIGLTLLGLIVNVVPEWRIIADTAIIPIVFAWSVYNMLILFLVCMTSLQASAKRGEERFASDEATWIMGATNTRFLGRLRDISVTGAGLVTDYADKASLHAGQRIHLLVGEVGLVPSRIMRVQGTFIGVEFDLKPGKERDLLIRKLFTSGHVGAAVDASVSSATLAVLKSIWLTPSTEGKIEAAESDKEALVLKLPAASLVIPPRHEVVERAPSYTTRKFVA